MSMVNPTASLGALINHVADAMVETPDAEEGYSKRHLTSLLPRTWWRHPEAMASIDIDLGAQRDVGTVFLGGLNLGKAATVSFWASASASPSGTRYAPDAIIESVGFEAGDVADLGGDPTNPGPAKPGIATSAPTSTITCSFPTPSSFLAGRYHRVRVLLEEGPSADLDTDIVSLWVQEGDAPPIASYAANVDSLPQTRGFHELWFDSNDLAEPTGSSLRISLQLRSLSGTTILRALDLVATPASVGPPTTVAAWPPNRGSGAGTLGAQAGSWAHSLDVAHHLSGPGGYGNQAARYIRIDIDNKAAGVPVEAQVLRAGPTLHLGARVGAEHGGEVEAEEVTTPGDLDVVLPSLPSRVDKVSARLDASQAEAFRELVVLRNEGEPLVFHHSPTRGRSWSMPYLARLGERPRLVNVRPGTTTDADRYEVTVEAREVKL